MTPFTINTVPVVMASGEQPRIRINSEQEITREYAAILLKVPDSGQEWLDEMIVKSLRNDLTAQNMSSFISNWKSIPEIDYIERYCKEVVEASKVMADIALEQQGYKEKETE